MNDQKFLVMKVTGGDPSKPILAVADTTAYGTQELATDSARQLAEADPGGRYLVVRAVPVAQGDGRPADAG
jgi:hypothetical protein